MLSLLAAASVTTTFPSPTSSERWEQLWADRVCQHEELSQKSPEIGEEATHYIMKNYPKQAGVMLSDYLTHGKSVVIERMATALFDTCAEAFTD